MKIAFNPSTVAALIAPPNNKDITFDLRGQNIFARGVKFCGTDTNTWRDIKINNVSIDSNILDLRDGDNTTLTNINGIVTINSTWRPVVDNLTSDSTTSSLSANQGRVLAGLINGKSDSDHNHDDRYLRLTGGWMSGDINFGGDNRICWGRNTDSASISFKNDGDGDADSYMSFATSDNGNEYFRWSHNSGSTNTEWMALRSDGLRVGGTKVSLEGHSHNDLYYTKTEVNNKLNGKSDTGHTHDDRYLKLTGGTMTGIIRATNRGGPWISGRDRCLIRSDDKTPYSYWSAILAIATVNGYWTLGHLGDGGEKIGFNYDTDTDYNAGHNNNHVIWLPTGGATGTLALTSDIPTSLKNPYALTISLNGTSQGPYDGSAAKNINITPNSIGAATSDHNHDGRYVRYYAVTTLDCNNLAAGLTVAGVSATNAALTNHSAFLYISDVGTPFQIQIPDSSEPYIYKRYHLGTWSGWFKLNAGYADSAGSVAWDNVTNKPSSFTPSAHTHTVFKNNLMIKGTNGHSDSASIHLGIGDSDTGFKWISDGVCQIYANNIAIGQWTPFGMNWFKNPTVNGNKVWNAGNDGSGSGLDADTLDGYHETAFPRLVGIKDGTWNWNDVIRAGYYKIQGGTITNHPSGINPFGMAEVITTENHNDGENRELQIYYPYAQTNNIAIWLRMHNSSTQGNGWGSWVGVPNTNGNIASATKLQTPRTIWGQSFDGTGNVDGPIRVHYKSGDWNNYNEGIRLYGNSKDDSWSNIHFGCDPAATSGSHANQWLIGRNLSNQFGVFHGTNSTDGIILITTNNNVGISTNTPAYKLDVNGQIRSSFASNNGNPCIMVNPTNDTDWCYGIEVLATELTAGHRTCAYWAGKANNTNNAICMSYYHAGDGSRDNRLIWHTWGSGDKMMLTADGRVGIGVTPSMKLHVDGDGIYLNSTATCGINMYSSHGESSISYKSNGGIRTVFGTYTNRTFLWNESIGEHVSILSSNGYFGIGTSFPTQRLDVNGNIRATGQIIRGGSSQLWVNGRNGALLRETSVAGYHTLWSLKTAEGSWDFGECNVGSGWNNIPVLSYITDSNYYSGNNEPTYQIKFPLASGTVALTSDILNYYWANVKISTSSSTTTSPTVHTLTATRVCAGHNPEIDNSISCSNWFRSSGNTGWQNTTYQGGWYMSDTSWIRAYSNVGIYTGGQIYSSSSIRMSDILLEHTNEINSDSGIYLNCRNSSNVQLCYGGGNVSIGYSSPSYKLDVNGQIGASGFHHSSVNSDNYMLLAGGGYKSFGGDDSHPIFLGYLNLDHGNDGTISSSFSCLGYSVPFTYTRGGNYCRIYIPDTTHQVFYIKAATASVNYSGGGMDTWVGYHRGSGAWWLHCYASGANEVKVKGFRQSNNNNDSWWGGNPLWSGNDGANKITVCIFGYVKFR